MILLSPNLVAQFTPTQQRTNYHKPANYTDCSNCADAWVGSAYYKIWGACASESGGQNDACNIYLWNNASWTDYEHLKNLIRHKYTAVSPVKRRVYIFVRTDAVNLLLGNAGHIGWAFELSDGSFFAGSTENPFNGVPDDSWYVAPGKDNGFWSQRFANESSMLVYIKNYWGYNKYKVVYWANPRLHTAKLRSEQCELKGFRGRGNNCLDHTYFVLDGLGLTGMPFTQTNPTPNGWFNEWYKSLTGAGKLL